MMYEILAQVMVKDALREADRNCLIKKAKQSRQIQNRRLFAKLARLFRLTQSKGAINKLVGKFINSLPSE